MIKIELLNIRIFLMKAAMKVGQEKYLFLTLFWKLILVLKKLNI